MMKLMWQYGLYVIMYNNMVSLLSLVVSFLFSMSKLYDKISQTYLSLLLNINLKLLLNVNQNILCTKELLEVLTNLIVRIIDFCRSKKHASLPKPIFIINIFIWVRVWVIIILRRFCIFCFNFLIASVY